MHMVGIMRSDWSQSVHPTGPGSLGPVQDDVKVNAAQVGRWGSVTLYLIAGKQFPKPLPILACPSPTVIQLFPLTLYQKM